MPYSRIFFFFFFNDTATTEIYTLSLHDALPIYRLVVILFSRLFNTGRRPRSPLSGHRENARRRPSVDSSRSNGSAGVSHTGCWDDVQRLLTYVYVQATAIAHEFDKVLLQVDVLLRGFDEDLCEDFGKDFEVVIRIEGGASVALECIS